MSCKRHVWPWQRWMGCAVLLKRHVPSAIGHVTRPRCKMYRYVTLGSAELGFGSTGQGRWHLKIGQTRIVFRCTSPPSPTACSEYRIKTTPPPTTAVRGAERVLVLSGTACGVPPRTHAPSLPQPPFMHPHSPSTHLPCSMQVGAEV